MQKEKRKNEICGKKQRQRKCRRSNRKAADFSSAQPTQMQINKKDSLPRALLINIASTPCRLALCRLPLQNTVHGYRYTPTNPHDLFYLSQKLREWKNIEYAFYLLYVVQLRSWLPGLLKSMLQSQRYRSRAWLKQSTPIFLEAKYDWGPWGGRPCVPLPFVVQKPFLYHQKTSSAYQGY